MIQREEDRTWRGLPVKVADPVAETAHALGFHDFGCADEPMALEEPCAKRIDEMTIEDYRRGVAKAFDTYRML